MRWILHLLALGLAVATAGAQATKQPVPANASTKSTAKKKGTESSGVTKAAAKQPAASSPAHFTSKSSANFSAKSTATSKSTAVKSTAAKSTATKNFRSAPASHAATTKAGARPKPPPVWRQQTPTTDRYKEIQTALADKGYFAGTPDGAWGADSVEAFKRFQRDQGLDADGKLGSLSLLALGLGPKRGATPAQEQKSEDLKPDDGKIDRAKPSGPRPGDGVEPTPAQQ